MPNITVSRDKKSSSSRPMPTPTRKSSGGSGSSKIREFEQRQESKSSPGESPTEYQERVESEKAAASQTPPSSPGTAVKIERISPQNSVPAPVNPAYREQYLKDQNKPKENVLSLPAEKEKSAAELRREIVQSQVSQSTSYIPFMKSPEQQLKEAEKKEQAAAMNLGRFEKYATSYEEKVATNLDVLTGNSNPALRFAGGAVEAVAYTPVAVPRLIAGMSRNPTATVQGAVEGPIEQVISDPARGLGQIAGMVAGGKALSKGGSVVKGKLPAVATGEQGFLVKFKVPESVEVPEPAIKPTIQAEYRGSGFGIDNFDIKSVNTEITPIKPTTKGIDVLVGETKGGYTDLYAPLSKEQAAQLQNRYTGNVRNINTPEGSFVEFEPTGIIESRTYSRSGPRVTTPEPELLGKMPESNIINPFGTEGGAPIRIEKRVNLQKGELLVSDSNRALLPEFTTTVDSRGRVVNDFNINAYYREPKIQNFLQLESGVSIIEAPRKGFFASEEATLRPRRQFVEYKEPTFIGEMPEMQTRFVRAERPLTVKDTELGGISRSEKDFIESLYRDAANKNELVPSPDKAFNIKRMGKTSRSSGILPFILPEINDLTIPEASPFSGGGNLRGTIDIPDIDNIASPQPTPSYGRSPKMFSGVPQAVEVNIDVLSGFEIPRIKQPYPFEKKKKKSSRKGNMKTSAWDYGRDPNEFMNPLDIDIGRFF
jgi:hypothetical protein